MRLTVIAVVLLLVIGACLMISCSGSPSMSTQNRPPTGPVIATEIACPTTGVPATSCFSLNISCPNIPNYTAYVKITAPSNPIGTIIFTTGGAGTDLYETKGFAAGTVKNVVSANYEAVQLTFGAPFSSAPGWQHDVNGQGLRAAACRYAMVVQWLAQQTPSVALCATGNSAGGGVIGEGLAHYGLGNYLAFAELTSGPPFSAVDQACDPNVPPEVEVIGSCSYDVGTSVGVTNGTDYIDPAYPGPWCSQQIETGIIQHQQQFQNDSITSPDAVLQYPTSVRFLFGGLDTSAATRNGLYYQSKITSPTSVGCVPDAPHDIPAALDGAQTIATDLIANCHK